MGHSLPHLRRVGPLVVVLSLLSAACSVAPSSTDDTPPESRPNVASADEELTLHSEGIGQFEVGDDAELVIAGVTDIVGGWDADSADSDSPIQLPECAQDHVRVVSWGSLALVFARGYAREVFTSWSFGFDPVTGNSDDLRNLNLETDAGIGLGATRNDLRDAYGSTLEINDQPAIDSAVFTVTAARKPHLSGKLNVSGLSGVIDLLQIEPTC